MDRYRRTVGLFVLIGGIGMTVLGLAWGYFWPRFGPYPAFVAILVICAILLYSLRLAEARVERLAKERIRYMRGGQGEALVAWLLEDLEDDWHIFNGLKLEADSDIDHVLVGPGGVYCISTKSQRGLFSGTAEGLLHNGKPSPFAQQAIGQGMDLSKRLSMAMGADVPWVQSVLAVPFGYTERDAYGGKVWLVHQDNLLDRLAPEDGPKRLTPQQLARTVKVLKILKETAADIYQRPDAPPSPTRGPSPANPSEHDKIAPHTPGKPTAE